ncbi:hypothetical protein SBDP2_90004 [Syntrophobacter sp. SbD2]|nr:hypothetical protein SBDP2_90004 [Syntrophobacter sp. SbD2]
MLSLYHEITGNPRCIEPLIPRLANRLNHAFVANRSDFNILHGFRKGDFLGQANSLTPVAFKNSGFHASHNGTPTKNIYCFRKYYKINGGYVNGIYSS